MQHLHARELDNDESSLGRRRRVEFDSRYGTHEHRAAKVPMRGGAVSCVGECATREETVAAILARRPDVVLLDIQLGRVSAFDIIEEIGAEATPLVIFVTAYDRHAIKAFEVQALNYVLKPVDSARLNEALQRAPLVSLDLDHIEWIESAGDYAGVHSGGRTYLMRSTLERLDRLAKGGNFIRVRRSALIKRPCRLDARALRELDSLRLYF